MLRPSQRAARLPAAISLALLVPAVEVMPARDRAPVIDLWTSGKPAFGVFARASDTREKGAALGANPLVDFVFLNLEGTYEPAAITAIADGLRSAGAPVRKTLIVRIPPIERDGPDAARARVKEAFARGADGVTVPHVKSAAEAGQAIAFFRDAEIDVWSPANSTGTRLAMLMIEDPGALAQAPAIAELGGYSILACGIGSLTAALGGDRAAAEAGNQRILAETRRARLVNMLTASRADVAQRVREGYLALIVQGQAMDEAIRIGRAAAGRD